ncbi:MAG TPA: C25 family cysteine peptidase, partial [Candidatus Cloacimonadota bacterium]|nr:C25 family cysteine peptidase [Candidatus Cloacimonadota bacterium]
VLQYHISTLEAEQIQIGGQTWHHIFLQEEGHLQLKGEPQLPVINRSIIIGNNAKMKLEVFDVEYTDLKLAIAPSKGVITRDIDPQTVPYEFGATYLSGSVYPSKIATLSDPYILRDFRGITVQTTPFAYKADTQTLRVYTSYKVRIYADGKDKRNTLSGNRPSISRAFFTLYENHFINFPSYRYTPVDDSFGKLLVVCPTSYLTAIQPWINWKKQKGIDTELVEWSSIGSTAAQLQTYIQNSYNQDNSLTFVQLVGDAAQIPTLIFNGGGSDPSFSLVAGSDNYPDIFIGRFSAENTDQLTIQLNRSIVYERDATTTDTWLSRAMGIASDQGGGSLGDNGESDIAHMNNIRSDLLGYGYTSVDQIYDPGATASTVTTTVNAGRGFINYIGHGSTTAWNTTGFNYNNAMALTNGGKNPFIMDVACVNGNFANSTCFAEGWMRNPNGGAITIYASTINQSWNSPMRAQDEVTDLWIANAKSSAGGYYYSGSCKMMDVYGNTSSSDGVKMFKTWHIFGDASLMVRSQTPQAMTVDHPSQIIIGASSMNISTSVPNALVSLTYDNQIYARGTTDSSGNLVLSLSGLPTQSTIFTITVTAYNRVTYIGSVQQISTPGSPRFVAEWEPAQGAIVCYPFGQPYSLLQDLAENSLLYVVVTETLQGTAHSQMQANGIDMDNVRYINASTDSYWIRDYGPWTIFDDDLNMHLVDFAYNRPRPNDDAVPPVIADSLDLGLYDLDMNHTGGNI